MTITPTQTVVVYVSLLTMFSPPATLGAAAAILSGASRAVQRRLAWEIGRNYAVVLLLAIWLGRYLLLLLGISSGALTATGGAALLYQGLPLMTRGAKSPEPRLEASKDSVAAGSSNWDQLACDEHDPVRRRVPERGEHRRSEPLNQGLRRWGLCLVRLCAVDPEVPRSRPRAIFVHLL